MRSTRRTAPSRPPQRTPVLLVGLIAALAAPILAIMALIGLWLMRGASPGQSESSLPTLVVASPSQTPMPTLLQLSQPGTTAVIVQTEPSLTLTGAFVTPGATPTGAVPAAASATVTPRATATSASLPSNTATAATATSTTIPTSAPATASATLTATPSPTSPLRPLPTVVTSGWRFINLTYAPNLSNTREGFIYGEVVNDTGAGQEITDFNITFYDGGGQAIPGTNRFVSYWPLEVVPAGNQMPFEIEILDIADIARADLSVSARQSENTPRADFSFETHTQSINNNFYCVQGQLRNAGSTLRDYLVIVVLLYDGHNNLVNFGDESQGPPLFAVGERLQSFQICIPPPYAEATRYELKAWGR